MKNKLKEEKKEAIKTILDNVEIAIEEDHFKTHELLEIIIHECMKLIKSDF